MLLIAPAGDAGPERIIAGLQNYAGDLSLLVGEEDQFVGRNSICLFDEVSPSARTKQLRFVPGCDHFFSSDEHNELLETTVMHYFSKLCE